MLVSALGQIDDALKDVGDTQLEPTGLLRINSSRVAARMLVEPHIGEFLTRYPKTKIELIMDDGLSNIIAEISNLHYPSQHSNRFMNFVHNP